MSKTLSLILTLTLGVLLARCVQAENGAYPNNNEEKIVTIELTKLDVNDTTLELRYKIKNGSDHDVWICDSVNVRETFNFEVFLAEDAQTLLIRKRLDVQSYSIWRRRPAGRYVRVRPGEDQIETLSLNLPVNPIFLFSSQGRTLVTQNARRLTLEIGFYDEDLPALVRSILQEAEKFSGTSFEADFEIKKQYFRGLWVRSHLGGFDMVNKDPYSEGKVLINYSYQALTGEKVLRIKVDGVSIPYEGYLSADSGDRSTEE